MFNLSEPGGLSAMDHFFVGDTVTVRLSDGPAFESQIKEVEFHEYSDFLKLAKGAEGYYSYLITLRSGRGLWVRDDQCS